MKNKLSPIGKSAEARKIMKPECAAQIEDLVSVINYNSDPYFIANNCFNYGYYQGAMAERASQVN